MLKMFGVFLAIAAALVAYLAVYWGTTYFFAAIGANGQTPLGASLLGLFAAILAVSAVLYMIYGRTGRQ